MIDYHIHTDISPDAEQALGDVVNRAREMGMSHIAITDHHDLVGGSDYEKWFIKDIGEYGKKIDEYKKKYKDIQVAKGIEISQLNDKLEEIEKSLDAADFDFVIASTHFVDGADVYYPEFYHNRSKQDTYYSYLKEIKDSIDLMDERVSVIGHIGYAARYSPYKDKKLRYEDFRETIDDILLKVIKRGFGIELNTSNYGRDLNEIMPPVPIIKRYRQLGGEIITIGSDAHRLSDIGKKYDIAKQIAMDAGFRNVSIFKNLKPEFIEL